MIQFPYEQSEQNKGIAPDLVPRYGFGASPDWTMTNKLSYEDQVNKLINWGAKTIELTVFPRGNVVQGGVSQPISDESMDVIKHLVKLNNIHFGLHAPYTSGDHPTVDIIHDPSSSFGKYLEKDSDNIMKQMVSVADKTGAKWINIHATHRPWYNQQDGIHVRPSVDKAKIYDVAQGQYIMVDRHRINKGGKLVWETDKEVAERYNREKKSQVLGQISSDVYNFNVHHRTFIEDWANKRARQKVIEDKEIRKLQDEFNNIIKKAETTSSEQERDMLYSIAKQKKEEIKEITAAKLDKYAEKAREDIMKNKTLYPSSQMNMAIEHLYEFTPFLDKKTIDDIENYLKENYPEFTNGNKKYLEPLEHLRKEVEKIQKERKGVWGDELKEGELAVPWKTAITRLGAVNLARQMEEISKYEEKNKIKNKAKLFVENPDIRFLGDVKTTAQMVKKAQDILIKKGRRDLAERLGMNLDTSHANSMWGTEYVDDKGRKQVYGTVMDQWKELKKDKELFDTIKHIHLNDSPAGTHFITPIGKVPKELGGMGVEGAEEILNDLKMRGEYDKLQFILESGALSGAGFVQTQEAFNKDFIGGYFYNAPVLQGVPTFASPGFYSDPLFMGQSQSGENNSYFNTRGFSFF